MEKQKDHFLALTDYPVIPIGTMSSKANEAGESAPPSYHQSLLPQVAVSQPPGVVYQYVAPTQVSPEEAPDHLVMAILATVCCCLPLGIVAIVKASDCKAQRAAGNRELAIRHSKAAKTWSLWAIALGVISTILFSVLYYIWLSQLQEMHY